MCQPDFHQQNSILDSIISARRTHRKFTDEPVSDEIISLIINAGLQAPYAGAAVSPGSDDFRKFFVIRKDSQTMNTLKSVMFHELEEMVLELDKAAASNDDFAEIAGGFIKRLAMIRKMGFVPGVGNAPVFLVVAEKKGFPPVEQASLAHCLENMWLKATALGLGFQLVSLTAQMEGIEEFSQIFSLRPGAWAFMGCAIGHPETILPPVERPPLNEVITWLP
jgi:nitroreductase